VQVLAIKLIAAEACFYRASGRFRLEFWRHSEIDDLSANKLHKAQNQTEKPSKQTRRKGFLKEVENAW
jgi:hypothetical protein